MKIQSLFENLHFVGQAEGDRRTYHVFEGKGAYLLVAANNRDGFNVTGISLEAPGVIQKRFKGKRVTAAMIQDESRRPDLFRSRFEALGALYVLAATRRAKKLKKREGRALIFKVT